MRPLEWRDALSIGHAEIDAQHARIVEAFNELRGCVYAGGGDLEAGRLLDALIALSAENFATEEALMEALGDGEAHWRLHRDVHQALLREMRLLRQGLARRGAHVTAKTVNFVRQWLFDHIQHTDAELGRLACERLPASGKRRAPAEP